MGAAELRQRAIELAKPPSNPSEPMPEPTGLIDRTNWFRFNLADLFSTVWPQVQFFAEPVERWPRHDYHDWLQWRLARAVGREWVSEVQTLWEATRADQDSLHRAMMRGR